MERAAEGSAQEDPGDIAGQAVPEEGEYAEQSATEGMIVRSNQSILETYSGGNMVKDADQVEVGELPIGHPGNTRDIVVQERDHVGNTASFTYRPP